tara:strand:- start:838 stop:1974 length:1137 start_codon:yes stop_codon:yes gene_type:complete
MPLFEGTHEQYYGAQEFATTSAQASGGADAGEYVLTFPANQTLLNNLATMPESAGEIRVDTIVSGTTTIGVDFTFNPTTYTVTLASPVAVGSVVTVRIINPQYGNYQFISLQTIINNFMISYVGSNKIIPKVRKADVAFHAQRAIQELSYDTFKSSKSMEIEVTPSLRVALPHDYVNYIKVCYIDDDGIERILYPARKTGNPISYAQDSNGDLLFQADSSLLYLSDSTQWTRYQGANEDESGLNDPKRSDDDFESVQGRRFGLEPEHAQFNGIFYIDEHRGYINLSSSMSGKILVLKYISDGLGTDDEMIVHKFAEEAMYKCIAYAIASTHTSVAPTYIPLLKRERFVAIRNAKLRLSNLKIEELAQVMRGKSKFIKH